MRKLRCTAAGMMLGNSLRRLSVSLKDMKSKASFCKYQDGNVVTDIKSTLELWRAHLNAILNGDDTNNPANEMIRPSRPNTLDNTTPVAPPDQVNGI